MPPVGDVLKKIRCDRNMTLRDVEKITNISNSYLSQLENGTRGMPTLKTLKKLAFAYGFEVHNLITLIDNYSEHESIPPIDSQFICPIYSQLSPEHQKLINDLIAFLLTK